MRLTSEHIQFILAHECEDVRKLALRKSIFASTDMPFLLAQIAGRQIAKNKIPWWYSHHEIIYPIHLSIEQASSEITARYKSSLLPTRKNRMVDLTGGMGVDFSFLSQNFNEAIYVEQNKDLCEIAALNFQTLGLLNTTIENERSEILLQRIPRANLIYLDPSRRNDAGQKVFRIEDCSPNVADIKNTLLEKAESVFIKYSPMLDISLAVKTLQFVSEVHIISVNNECKELLFILKKHAEKVLYTAVNLKTTETDASFSFTLEEERASRILYTSEVESYLYEPNASLLKAGAFNSVCHRFNLKKLHKNTHLYTSENLVSHFPGRIFKVEDVFSPDKSNLKSFFVKTKKANIAVRNFPMSVSEIRKKTKIEEGGDIYVFAATLQDERKVWITCKKIQNSF